MITEAVATNLALPQTGWKIVHTAAGTAERRPTYIVSFFFPGGSGLVAAGLVVTSSPRLGAAEALIGMDVIGSGDFVVLNQGGKSRMTYRYPSQLDVDFVKETKREMLLQSKRNKGPQGPAPKRGKRR